MVVVHLGAARSLSETVARAEEVEAYWRSSYCVLLRDPLMLVMLYGCYQVIW
jgi:hypothetical protein